MTHRLAVVTGGTSGVGLGVGRQYASEGHRVALLDHNGPAAEHAADELRTRGVEALAVAVDVAEFGSVAAAFEQVRDQLGPVEILVTSAGIESFSPALSSVP